MKATEFAVLDPLVESLDESCEQWLMSDQLAELREALRKAAAALPPNYSVTIDVELRVFDQERDQAMHLLSTGLSSSGGATPYRTSGDCSIHRYIADGELCELPHDRCPRCWDIWDFKQKHPACSHCGASLGHDVKLLLDRDTCPHCEKGHLTAHKPQCDNCGFMIDPSFVNWG